MTRGHGSLWSEFGSGNMEIVCSLGGGVKVDW